MSIVDDYGRYEAHPEILRTACYPLRVDKVKASNIEKWLQDCVQANLIVLYKVSDKTFLQLTDWKQQTRSASKFPAPDKQLISVATQMLENDSLVVVGDVGVVGVEGVGKALAPSDKSLNAKIDSDGSKNGNAVCFIPLNDGTEYAVTAKLAAEFELLYPAVDVPQTLREIRGWNIANPKQRKTRIGVLKHINFWLSKEQNREPYAKNR